MIKINHLRKEYGENVILDNVFLEIDKGDIYGLVGRSGAGKSTLLRCMNGLEKYDKGSLFVAGKEISRLSDKELRLFRRNVGMIFQHFSLAERQTVEQNIALPMKWWKYNRSEIDKKVAELLEIVDLSDKKDSKPRELSGGQKQRVAIARALAMDPEILLCDEATSALDPNTTNSILSLLEQINKDMNITIVIVTHEMSVVRQICDKIAVLDNGRIAASGNVKDIFFQKPDALSELLGKSGKNPSPQSGINLRIILNDQQMKQPVLSDLALETKARFVITQSSTEQYKDGFVEITDLNIESEKVSLLTKYFDEYHIAWQEIENE